MIYTPKNTSSRCLFTREDTDTLGYNRVFLVDTDSNELHNYDYPFVWDEDDNSVLASTIYRYSSIDVALDEYGFPVEFILKGLIK
jgi:hypothetical protein